MDLQRGSNHLVSGNGLLDIARLALRGPRHGPRLLGSAASASTGQGPPGCLAGVAKRGAVRPPRLTPCASPHPHEAPMTHPVTGRAPSEGLSSRPCQGVAGWRLGGQGAAAVPLDCRGGAPELDLLAPWRTRQRARGWPCAPVSAARRRVRSGSPWHCNRIASDTSARKSWARKSRAASPPRSKDDRSR